jgi:uncharacterized protein
MKQRDRNVLIVVTTGPDDPTKAALAFLLARTALEEGHAVDVFLAGDGVNLIREQVRRTLNGVGTGNLQESLDHVARQGGRLFLSKRSCEARDIEAAELDGLEPELAPPNKLVQLTMAAEKVLTF